MNFDSGITMTYKVEEVLETLRKNLEEHLVIYNEALEGFRKEGMATLTERLEELAAILYVHDGSVGLAKKLPDNCLRVFLHCQHQVFRGEFLASSEPYIEGKAS
jgi:hypothetical protein